MDSTFLTHARCLLCKFRLNLIQKVIVNYISFHKNFLNECIFDIVLSITLQYVNFIFSGITSTCEKIFTSQDFFFLKNRFPHIWITLVFNILRSYFRSSHPELFFVKGVLKIYSKFTGDHPRRSVVSINLRSNFIEITLRHGCSPVNLLHIFRTLLTKNTSERLLLLFPCKRDKIPSKIFKFNVRFILKEGQVN